MAENEVPVGEHKPAKFLVVTPKGQAIKCKDEADCKNVVESAVVEFLGEFVDIYKIMTCARRPGVPLRAANDEAPSSPLSLPSPEVDALTVEDIINALNVSGLQLHKVANTLKNVGKTPELVLAEQLSKRIREKANG